MPYDKDVLRDVIRAVISAMNMWSHAAEELMMGTAAQESGLGRWREQMGRGGALGVFQMEPFTHDDTWANFIEFRPDLKKRILDVTGLEGPSLEALEHDLIYSIVMARVYYWRHEAPLPGEGDLVGQAEYWKEVYNTVAGRGTPADYIESYTRLVDGIAS